MGPRRPRVPARPLNMQSDPLQVEMMAAEVTVRVLEARDLAQWDANEIAHPDATFFHRVGWKRASEQAFSHRTHFMLAERGGEIVGVLPLAEIRSRLFGHSLGSLPFCAYGGILADHDAAWRALDEAAQALAVRQQVGARGCRHQEAPPAPRAAKG